MGLRLGGGDRPKRLPPWRTSLWAPVIAMACLIVLWGVALGAWVAYDNARDDRICWEQ